MSKVIRLIQLKLRNFKGIKDFTFSPNGENVSVLADNGRGKTTLNDAWCWLLFDKDSHDVSKFDVQPLDAQGNVIHMLETEVEGTLNIDGKNVTLKKALKEKWVKKRGEVDAELKGTEAAYYVDEVPFKQGEYKQYIGNIIGEKIFKLITNPAYFPLVLGWQDRRKILFDMNGDVSQEDVINYNSKLADLTKYLNQGETMDAFQKRVKAQLAKLKKDKQDIPSRVDEQSRSIQEIDFVALGHRKQYIESVLNGINEKLMDSSKAGEDALNDRKHLFELKSKLLQIEQDAKAKAQEPYVKLQNDMQQAGFELNKAQSKLQFAQSTKNSLLADISKLDEQNGKLREQWRTENAKTLEFAEDAFTCPTCGRPFDEEDVETKQQEMQENFNRTKAESLKAINEQGKLNNTKIDQLKQQIEALSIETLQADVDAKQTQIDSLKGQIESFNPTINYLDIPGYKDALDEKNTLETKLQQPDPTATVANAQLREQKSKTERELQEVNSHLAYKDTNDRAKARIRELMDEEKRLAQQIADAEKQEYLGEQFIKTKVELLESSINSKFKYVRFKLFNMLVNGGIEETCEPMVNGVPFGTNLNSGARINAGIDIISSLCNYYGVQAPIFIDNRESVTKIIPISSQVVSLIVSEKDKALRIERG